MTFLIFLLSLAVLEYVVRRSGTRAGEDKEAKRYQALKVAAETPGTEGSPAEGLHNLVAALERYGHGTPPEATGGVPDLSRMQEEKAPAAVPPVRVQRS